MTSSRTPGILRHPSLKDHSSPDSSIISGLIKVLLNFFNLLLSLSDKDSSSEKGSVSTKNNLIDKPICGAANPTPFAPYIVSYISEIRELILG